MLCGKKKKWKAKFKEGDIVKHIIHNEKGMVLTQDGINYKVRFIDKRDSKNNNDLYPFCSVWLIEHELEFYEK